MPHRNFGLVGRRPRMIDNTSVWLVYKFLIVKVVLVLAIAALVLALVR